MNCWSSVVGTTLTSEEQLSKFETDLFTPYLSEKEWATMVRIQVQEGDLTSWKSGFKQSLALAVTASHKCSQDMDPKAYGIAMSRLAIEWVAKTQSICVVMHLTSESAYMNPLTHLHAGDWPCLEHLNCLGRYGNVLPVSCFWGEHMSNLHDIQMFKCSLGADMIQSLVSTCPHLRNLTLIGCKVDAAALAYLSQVCFLRLCNLIII